MKPNERLEKVLREVPEDLRGHYMGILAGTPEGGDGELPEFYTVEEIREQAAGEAAPVVHGTGWGTLDAASAGGIAQGELALLAAESGAGKTHFAVNLAMNYANRDLRVCYLSMEDGYRMIADRFERMDPNGKTRRGVFMLHEDELTVKNSRAVIGRAVADSDLIIIDNLFSLPLRQGKADFWNSQAEWVDDVANIVRSTQSSALVLHHINKSKEPGAERYQVAGSTRLVNRAGLVWLLVPSADEPGTVTVKVDKCRRSMARGEAVLRSQPSYGYRLQEVRPPSPWVPKQLRMTK